MSAMEELPELPFLAVQRSSGTSAHDRRQPGRQQTLSALDEADRARHTSTKATPGLDPRGRGLPGLPGPAICRERLIWTRLRNIDLSAGILIEIKSLLPTTV